MGEPMQAQDFDLSTILCFLQQIGVQEDPQVAIQEATDDVL
jgi:hypothetical protein